MLTRFATLVSALLASILVMPARDATAASTTVYRSSATWFSYNFCNEESIYLEGTWQWVTTWSDDGTVTTHFSARMTGTGDQGHTYLLSTQWRTSEAPNESDYRGHERRISLGDVPNELIEWQIIAGEYVSDDSCVSGGISV